MIALKQLPHSFDINTFRAVFGAPEADRSGRVWLVGNMHVNLVRPGTIEIIVANTAEHGVRDLGEELILDVFRWWDYSIQYWRGPFGTSRSGWKQLADRETVLVGRPLTWNGVKGVLLG